MGFEDREYFQQDQAYTSWGSDTPTTKRLLIITVAVFFAQSLLVRETANLQLIAKFHSTIISYVDEWFMLDASAALSGQIWRLVTYAFCHDRQSAISLVFNMVVLWFFGRRLERMYGSREFLLFYLGATIAAGLLFVGIGSTTPLPFPLSGANPAVMALFALYAFHFPREEMLFFFLIPVQIFVLLLIYVGLDVYSVLQAMQGSAPWPYAAITAAHVSGAGYAYLYKHFDWHLDGLWRSVTGWRKTLRRRAVSSSLRVYDPSPVTEELDAKVDAILAKIHEHGSESLTAAERATLEKASERERNKRSF